MDLGTLSFSNQSLEERFCEEELAEFRRRRSLGIGQDAGRLFGVLAGAGRRVAAGRFPQGNALPLTALVFLQLWEWRLHHTKAGSWRFRCGLGVIVTIYTLIYMMRLTHVFLDPLNNPRPLGVAAFYLVGSGIGVLHLAGFATLVPYQWSLIQQSILTLLLIDPARGFCAAQPHVRKPIATMWTAVNNNTDGIDDIRICTRVTRVALVLFGFVASILTVYRTQLLSRREFLRKFRSGQRGRQSNASAVKASPSVVSALPGLLPPLTVFLFYITFKDLAEL